MKMTYYEALRYVWTGVILPYNIASLRCGKVVAA